MPEDNRREYLRIKDSIQIHYRVVDETAAEELTRERMARPSIHNLALIRALEEASHRIEEEQGISVLLLHKIIEMDDKLARILAVLENRKAAEGTDCVARTATLSAGGCSIAREAGLDAGTRLDLVLFLPTFPPMTIRAVGTIVRAGADESAEVIAGVQFTAIHEEDREMLYHYLFQRQREQIRQTSRGPGILASP
ncbi:MAG TPA: PilZ domain-containing protein [Verrucomicrobiae bacterium]|nr:PilZ domain-containing protein [Verrucomicrobiae bacterium]